MPSCLRAAGDEFSIAEQDRLGGPFCFRALRTIWKQLHAELANATSSVVLDFSVSVPQEHFNLRLQWAFHLAIFVECDLR